jgi:hypothetical protein
VAALCQLRWQKAATKEIFSGPAAPAGALASSIICSDENFKVNYTGQQCHQQRKEQCELNHALPAVMAPHYLMLPHCSLLSGNNRKLAI